MTKQKKAKLITALPDGTVVQYDDGTHVTRGIVCRPQHLDSAVVYTTPAPGGYAGLTEDADRFWSVVADASDVYRSEAIQTEMVFRQRYA